MANLKYKNSLNEWKVINNIKGALEKGRLFIWI